MIKIKATKRSLLKFRRKKRILQSLIKNLKRKDLYNHLPPHLHNQILKRRKIEDQPANLVISKVQRRKLRNNRVLKRNRKPNPNQINRNNL
jgi:hypothetical protein